ncbi:hypothetical protein B0H13DRAFT_2262744 [Mycena leptocephala]|nr:hypothetical protein B0H13DRAFT_2262744 [Mycena leptocephala]
MSMQMTFRVSEKSKIRKLSGATLSLVNRALQPIDADLLVRLLEICANIEAFVWESEFPPPDGLYARRTQSAPAKGHLAPPPLSTAVQPRKWNAPSLPLLTGIPVASDTSSLLFPSVARLQQPRKVVGRGNIHKARRREKRRNGCVDSEKVRTIDAEYYKFLLMTEQALAT